MGGREGERRGTGEGEKRKGGWSGNEGGRFMREGGKKQRETKRDI